MTVEYSIFLHGLCGVLAGAIFIYGVITSL